MKKLFLGLTLLFAAELSFGQLIKPIAKPESYKTKSTKLTAVAPLTTPITMWSWRPIAVVPLGRYQNGQFSTVTVGGGIALQYLKFDDSTGRWNSIVSISPLTVLTGVNVNGNAFSLSYAATVGILNNLVTVGYGYDLMQRQTFFLLGTTINFNN